MFDLKIKKIISTVLVIAMIFTSTGFTTFADSIDDVTKVSSENNEKASSSKYYDEFIEEQISDTVGANLPNGSQEFEEPEESDTVGADTIRPLNVEEDTVVADTIRPSNVEEDTVVADTIRPSNVEEDTVGADTIRPSNVEDESITVDEKREDERSTKEISDGYVETSDGYVEASDDVVETSDDFVEVEHCETTYRMGELSEPEESDTVVADTIRPSNVEEDTVVADTIRPSNVEEDTVVADTIRPSNVEEDTVVADTIRPSNDEEIKEDAMIDASSSETSTTIKPVENEEVINQDFNLESEVANVSTYSELSEPTEIEDEKNIITSATFSEIENINDNKDIAQNISTNSIIENEVLESNISTESNVLNIINLKIATTSTEKELFGAPVDYVLPRDWYNAYNAGAMFQCIETITFSKNPDPVPATFTHRYEIPGSNGLVLYANVVGSGYDAVSNVTIYAPADGTIYAPSDSSSLLTSPENGNNLRDIVNLTYLNTSQVTNMYRMFQCLQNLSSIDLSSFNTTNVTNMQEMFGACHSLTTIDVSNFNTINVTNMEDMFSGCNRLATLDLSNFDTSNVTNMQGMFSGCGQLTSLNVSSFNTANVTDMSVMFSNCNNLQTLNVSNFDTSNVTNMQGMFVGCGQLTSLNVSSFNTSNVTNMKDMFRVCGQLTSLNLSNFNTSNVTTMESMFSQCTNLGSLNVSSFDTRNVTNMSNMFYYCDNLRPLNISNFNTSNVTDMSGMFNRCRSLTSLNLRNFDTSNVRNMSQMFASLVNVTTLDLTSFDTRNVTDMTEMFSDEWYGSNINTIIASTSFVTTAVTNDSDMFKGCPLVGGFGTRRWNKYIEDATTGNNKTFAWIDGRHGLDGYFTKANNALNIGLNAASISVVHEPSKINYHESECFDPSGLLLEVTWDDGYTNIISYDNTNTSRFSFNPSLTTNLNRLDSSVDITYCGVSFNVPINIIYDIIWDLSDGTSTDVVDQGTWTGTIGTTSYIYGLGLASFPTVTPPVGRSFSHWKIIYAEAGIDDLEPADSVSATTYGDITIKVIYTKVSYSIDWHLGAGNLNPTSLASTSYMYGINYILPSSSQVVCVPGYEFDYWTIRKVSDGSLIDHATSIPIGIFGDIEIIATYRIANYNITWELGPGSLNPASLATPSYTYGTNYPLPLPTQVVCATGQEFVSWKIVKEDGTEIPNATSISNTMYGDIEIVAVYSSATYNIAWDLYDGTSDELIDRGTWSNIVGTTTYTYGTGLTTLPDTNDVIPPQGRNFAHWKIIHTGSGDSDLDPATNVSTTTWGNITIKAVYTNVSYNITWDLHDGASTDVIDEGSWSGAAGANIYTYGIGLTTLPTNVTPPQGRNFDHWKIIHTESGAPDLYPAASVSTTTWGNITIKAVYTNVSYNITWDLHDGASTDAIDEGSWSGTIGTSSYIYGLGLASFPTVTPPVGRSFLHWKIIYAEPGIADLDPATNVNATTWGNITIKAVYANVSYNITWDLYDGTSGADVDQGSVRTVCATTYTYRIGLTTLPDTNDVIPPEGRNFDHWKIIHTGPGDSDLDPATSVPTTTWGNITIKAVYTNKTYNITWDLRDGASTDAIDEGSWSGAAGANIYTYKIGLTTLPDTNDVIPPEGRDFDHWKIIYTGSGIADLEPATNVGTTTWGNITIKAVYTNISYNITWTLGEGNFIIANEASPSYTYGTTWPLPEAKQINAPIGQKLDYWTIRQGATDITHATSISRTTYGDVEIIAVYKFAPYDIIWDLGDGSFKDATIATMSYSYGDTWSLPNANTIKEPAGREFDHWIIRKYGDDDIDPATILPSTIYGDIEIIATYRNLSYNILWDLYDGTSDELIDRGTWSNIVGTTTYTYGTGLNSFPEILPPEGRNFDHWKIMHTESGDPDLDPATSVSTTTWGDIIIKAVYTNETYNIIWDLGDGKWKGSEGIDHYTYGTEITLPTNVTPPNGKTFNGWTINGETITKITNDSVGDITIVAVYKNKPSSGDDDNKGGSSGGSSSGGSTKGTINVNQNTTELGMVFMTPIQNNEYRWERSVDLKNKSYWIVKVLKTTSIAKVFMSSRDYAIYYKDIDENYIQIKNGIYCLQYLNQYYYFAFDFNGNMLTGIINTSDNTKQWTIDTTNGKLVESKFVGKAKYYFYDGIGDLYGVMWNQPITVNNILYTFDTNSKIIKETTISTENVLSSGTKQSWQYDAITNKWKFGTIDASGQMNYYKNGMYPIVSANGEINYYMFDENGELVS